MPSPVICVSILGPQKVESGAHFLSCLRIDLVDHKFMPQMVEKNVSDATFESKILTNASLVMKKLKQRTIFSSGWEQEVARRERTPAETLATTMVRALRDRRRRRRHPTDLGKTSCSPRALTWASPNAASASTTGERARGHGIL